MKDNPYSRILDRLRQIKPEPESAKKLTDSIMNGLDNVNSRKRRHLTLKVNETQWTIYKGLRVLMTTAAVFLIGFFVFQQRQINQKLSRMEKELANPHQYEMTTRYTSTNQFTLDSQQADMLQINRKSLNYMLREIQKLRYENISYRKKLLQLYPDSTHYNSNFN